MARRRMITQNINYDEDLNSVSIESQILFIKFLSISDDFGIIPASSFTLQGLINCPENLKKNFDKHVTEILSKNLMMQFEYGGKLYFSFKKESFDEQQAYLIKNRTKSEYLKLKKEEVESLFREISGKFSKNKKNGLLTYRKIKDKRRKIKEEGKENEPEIPEIPIEPKKDFFGLIAERFEKVFKESRGFGYEVVNEGKDRTAYSNILQRFKKELPDYKTEEMLDALEKFFKESAKIKDDFIHKCFNPNMIYNQINKILTILKNGESKTDIQEIARREKYSRIRESINP